MSWGKFIATAGLFGAYHIFFHSLLLTEDVIVVRTISGICYWVLRIEAICSIKLVH